MSGFRGALASVAAWVLGVVAAVSVGLVALAMIGNGLSSTPGEPLGQDVIDQAPTAPGGNPSASPSPSAKPSPSAAPSKSNPAATIAQRLVRTRGGTVVAQCRTNGAYLAAWSPAQGYQASEVSRGPAGVAKVTFKSKDRDVKVTVTCPQTGLRFDIDDEKDQDHD